ncbi:MAG: TetR/AcrR family transcriptional regulator [Henriciella sp.]
MQTSDSAKARKRTRLTPAERRSQLLDAAQKLIAEHGVSSFTMELVAKVAGVSNPLVYKYFDTRLMLLQELLVREVRDLETTLVARLHTARDYSDVVEVFVRVDFEQAQRSNTLEILANQPDIRVAIDGNKAERRQKFNAVLINGLKDMHAIPTDQAVRILTMASGASRAAAEAYRKYGGDPEKMIAEAKALILAGIDAVANLNSADEAS